MLDDLTIEQALRDAADAIVVPAEGPARVIAARDAANPARHRAPDGALADPRKRRLRDAAARVRRRPARVAVLVLASCALLGVVAVVADGGGPHPVASAPRALKAAGLPSTATPPVANAGGADEGVVGSAASGGSALEGSGTVAAPNLVPGATAAKVIKNGSMVLRVSSVESVVEQLAAMAGGAGGYVSTSSSSAPGGTQSAVADVTVRVPVAGFEAFASQVEALGSPAQVTMSGQDVTSQYADLNARLQALQSTINQLQLIERRAQTIGDILAVEQQISDQQSQADQIQGQINVLSDETTYGSLSVHIVGAAKKGAVAPPPSGISKAWDHARHSFARGFEAVIGALGGIAVFLLFAGVVLALAVLGWSVLRRRLV